MTCCPNCGHKIQTEERQNAGITERQRDLLKFITGFQDENGFSPSFAEMADGIGLTSRSSIHRLVGGLVDRGVINHRPNRNRSIVVIGGGSS